MKTPNAIPIFLVCLLAVLAEGANTSLTNSHARRSIDRNHHNHQRHAHSGGRRDGSYVASELRRTEAKRLDLDDVAKIADAIGLPAPPGGSTTDSATSTSTTDTTSSTASSTDSASSTSVTDTASSTSATDSATSTSDSATSTASSTSSASSSVSTDSASSDSATSTESATSASATDSATSTESVSDSATATVSDPPPTSASDSATATVTDPPPTSASDSSTATVTDPPVSTPTVSDPPASSTKAECDPLDVICIGSTLLFPTSTPTSDSQVSTPAPTSDTPQTDSSTATATVSDPPQTDSSTATATVSDPPQTDSSTATATVSDPPSSTSDIVSDIVNTLSSLLPTDTATRTFSDLPTQTDSATQSDRPTDTVSQSDSVTQSDKPTDTQTQSDQPTQTDTSSGTQTISQPPPTITDSFSVTDSFSNTITDSFSNTNTNTRTITGSDSPTDSATESATRTESVSFPTLTDSPTDSQPTATATDSSASDSITDSVSMTMTTEPIPSEYSYITDQSLALTSLPATSTLALTLTDPDAAFTTASLTQSGTNAPSQAVAFPTQLPTRIFPANRLDPNDPSLDGMVLVSLKFLSSLTWAFVVNNSNTAALLFVYTPQAIANALGISTDQVKTFAMQAFSPADWTGDISQLSTVYLLYIPADQVDALQQQLLAQNSPLYTNQAGIPKQISQQLDATFPVNAVGLDTAIVGTGNTANGNNSGAADASAASRRDAIIGVCAAFGVILLAVVAWWVYKSWKRRQDRAHRRLTHDSAGMHQAGGYGATTQTAYGTVYGAAPQRSGYAQPNTPMYNTAGAPIANPFEDSSYEEDPDERRRSFFYAEDSLRGFTVPREEDQGITYTQLRHQQQGLMPNDGKRRAPIQASAISAPILRESSLNW